MPLRGGKAAAGAGGRMPLRDVQIPRLQARGAAPRPSAKGEFSKAKCCGRSAKALVLRPTPEG